MNSEIYSELIDGILKVLGSSVLLVVLYGSVARGTETDDSDVDIAVFVTRSMTAGEEDRLSDFIVDMNLKYDKVFSVIDVNHSVYEKWRHVTPFYQNVESEGIVLWTAA